MSCLCFAISLNFLIELVSSDYLIDRIIKRQEFIEKIIFFLMWERTRDIHSLEIANVLFRD